MAREIQGAMAAGAAGLDLCNLTFTALLHLLTWGSATWPESARLRICLALRCSVLLLCLCRWMKTGQGWTVWGAHGETGYREQGWGGWAELSTRARLPPGVAALFLSPFLD